MRKLRHQEIKYRAQGHLLKGGIKTFSGQSDTCVSVPDYRAVSSVMVDLGTKQRDRAENLGKRLTCWGTSLTSHVRKLPRAKCIPGHRTRVTPGKTAGKQRCTSGPRKGCALSKKTAGSGSSLISGWKWKKKGSQTHGPPAIPGIVPIIFRV